MFFFFWTKIFPETKRVVNKREKTKNHTTPKHRARFLYMLSTRLPIEPVCVCVCVFCREKKIYGNYGSDYNFSGKLLL